MARGRPSIIPEDLLPEILKRHGAGESTDKIALWVGEQMGRKVDGRLIRTRLARVRKDRKPFVEAAVAEGLVGKATADLQGVSGQIADAEADERKARTGAAVLVLGSLEWKRAMDVVHSSAVRRHQSYELRFKLLGVLGDGGSGSAPSGVVELPMERD